MSLNMRCIVGTHPVRQEPLRDAVVSLLDALVTFGDAVVLQKEAQFVLQTCTRYVACKVGY